VKERVSRSHSLKETQSRKEKKETKDGQHGLPVSLKQKITNVLYPDREHAESPKESTHGRSNVSHPPPSLYSALDSCLYLAVQASCNPTAVQCNPLFISKWIDYSNKYGFGFQLSDRTVGVLFNDSTRISYSGDRR